VIDRILDKTGLSLPIVQKVIRHGAATAAQECSVKLALLSESLRLPPAEGPNPADRIGEMKRRGLDPI
jgi:hypothetical protein